MPLLPAGMRGAHQDVGAGQMDTRQEHASCSAGPGMFCAVLVATQCLPCCDQGAGAPEGLPGEDGMQAGAQAGTQAGTQAGAASSSHGSTSTRCCSWASSPSLLSSQQPRRPPSPCSSRMIISRKTCLGSLARNLVWGSERHCWLKDRSWPGARVLLPSRLPRARR